MQTLVRIIVSLLFDPMFWAAAVIFAPAIFFKPKYKIVSWLGIGLAAVVVVALIAQRLHWIG